MADTLDQIYMNTSLGETELTDGEHTLVTTDANTSYVIKDMNLIGSFSSLDAGSHLELNGFNVSDLTSNATGSLVVPPSSTLKIKTGSTFPFVFEQTENIGLDGSNYGYVEKVIRIKGQSDVFSTPLSLTSTAALSSGNNNEIINIDFNIADNGNGYWYHTQHDTNSAQQTWYVGQVSGSGQNEYLNYAAVGTGHKLNGDFIGYASSGSTFYIKDIDATPTGNFTGGATTYNRNPHPTSSYPRHFFAYDHIWFMPSNSYTSQMYALNVNNGGMKSFTGMPTINYPTGGNNFAISHDAATDSIYIWRVSSTNVFQVAKVTPTLTDLLADTNNATIATTNMPTIHLSPAQASTPLLKGSPTAISGGGIRYFSTGNNYVSIYPDGTQHSAAFSYSGIEIAGASRTLNYYKTSTKTLSASEATALGLATPTFGIQLLGIKSET